MDCLPVIMEFAGIIVAVILAVIITLRTCWVRDTYGADFDLYDKFTAVMTPELWVFSALAIMLIGIGSAAR